jgi:hypothetical protein
VAGFPLADGDGDGDAEGVGCAVGALGDPVAPVGGELDEGTALFGTRLGSVALGPPVGWPLGAGCVGVDVSGGATSLPLLPLLCPQPATQKAVMTPATLATEMTRFMTMTPFALARDPSQDACPCGRGECSRRKPRQGAGLLAPHGPRARGSDREHRGLLRRESASVRG